jgi:hypothetical protein
VNTNRMTLLIFATSFKSATWYRMWCCTYAPQLARSRQRQKVKIFLHSCRSKRWKSFGIVASIC